MRPKEDAGIRGGPGRWRIALLQGLEGMLIGSGRVKVDVSLSKVSRVPCDRSSGESDLQRPEAPERCNVDGLRGVRACMAWHQNGCGRMYSFVFVEGGWLKSSHRYLCGV
jgi:hypothetical protein